MFHTINNLFTKFFDAVLTPFRLLGEFWEILFLSFVSSFIVLLVYKHASSPSKIREAKNRIKANILAIRLYKDFWQVILKSFFKSLYYTGKYFVLNFGPVLIILPLLLIPFFQMDVRYGMRSFNPGEEMVLKVSFRESPIDLNIKLLDSEYYTRVINPVFIASFDQEGDPIREVNWKLRAKKRGNSEFNIRVGENTYRKNIAIGETGETLSGSRFFYPSPNFAQFWYPFIYPVEEALSDNGVIREIWVSYPGKSISFLFIHTHWLVYYLVLVLIFVLAFRKRFGVEF